MNNRRNILIAVIGIISMILITTAVTYSFFSYARVGTTENSITTGTITFLYTEVSGVGAGISISEAFPISDDVGKLQTGEGKVFDFKITSSTNSAEIPYEVTARLKKDSTLSQSAVKLYLTELEGNTEKELLLDTFDNLEQTNKIDSNVAIEKVIYQGKVAANSTNYEKNFRLRMWILDGVDYSSSDYNGKTFAITVNVYANAKVVSSGTETLRTKVMENPIIDQIDDLTTYHNNSKEVSGLYVSTSTNTGEPTYYYSGNVENNYVSFAGFTWRILRVNEDNTVRMILAGAMNDNTPYVYNSNRSNYEQIYFSNSEIKNSLENWYDTNLLEYDEYIADGTFCEEAKVSYDERHTAGNVTMTLYHEGYVPNFKCTTDLNGKGIVNTKIGLITFEDASYAGMHPYNMNKINNFLYYNDDWWLMSPEGIYEAALDVNVWYFNGYSLFNGSATNTNSRVARPIINLKADVLASGSGTLADPYVIEGSINTINALKSISISDYSSFYRYDPYKTSYGCSVDRTIEEVTVTAEAITDNIKIEGLGTYKIELGTNPIIIKTTSAGGLVEEYNISINRPKDSNSQLSSLSLSDCVLSTSFNSSTYNYSCTVGNDIDSTIVTAEVASEYATVDGTGAYELVEGINTIKVIVTAENGRDSTYTITVTRES